MGRIRRRRLQFHEQQRATQTAALRHRCARRTKRWRWDVRRRRAASTSRGEWCGLWAKRWWVLVTVVGRPLRCVSQNSPSVSDVGRLL